MRVKIYMVVFQYKLYDFAHSLMTNVGLLSSTKN